MELFRLLGVLGVDTTEGIEALKKATNQASNTESGMSKAFTKIGSAAKKLGKAMAVGLAAGVTAVTGLSKAAIDSYADYEQLVGGVETLFKDSAGVVQEYAKTAYKSAGLSANEYMETVTSFSASLLQGLGGDTEKASEIANRAITDMSDNANKMGTDMSLIQNAYQGFAKQNYTMLDNLKLGYGGTQAEMARLINDSGVLGDAIEVTAETVNEVSFDKIIEAIGVIQDRMGITGTTAKEAASTISGSLASMKSSWANLLTAIASDDLPFNDYVTAFVDSVSTVASNLLPRIEVALNGCVQLIEQLAPVIIGAIPNLFTQLLPAVLTAAVGLVNSIVSALPSLVDILVNDTLPQLLSACETLFGTIVSVLPVLLESIMSALPSLLPLLMSTLVSIVVIMSENFDQIIDPLIENVPLIIVSITEALMANLPLLLRGVWKLIVAVAKAIPAYWGGIFSAIKESIGIVASYLSEWLSPVWEAISGWFSNLWQGVVDTFEKITNTIRIALQFIGAIFDAAFKIITLPFRFIWENCKEYVFAAFEWMKEKIETSSNWISERMAIVWGWIRDNIVTPVQEAYTKVAAVFENIKNAIVSKITVAKDKVAEVFNAIKSKISSVVENIKTDVTDKFEKVKSAMEKPMNKAKEAIEKVVNAIKGLFGGLKLDFPGIKLPHFGIKPKGWKIGDLLKGSIPELGIEWYAKGGVLTQPTVFGMNGNNAMVGGEAGAEAIAPISVLQKYVADAVASQNAGITDVLYKILDAILSLDDDMGENMRVALAGTSLKIGEREFARLVNKSVSRTQANEVRVGGAYV